MNLNFLKTPKSAFPKDWLEGLSEHVQLQVRKHSSQREYALSINLSPTYVSLAMNEKFENLSKSIIAEIAYKVNYDRENVREILDAIPERTVMYDNSKVRERVIPEPPVRTQDELVKEESKSQDEQVINKYLEDKKVLRSLPSDLKKLSLETLFGRFKQTLNTVNEKELC